MRISQAAVIIVAVMALSGVRTAAAQNFDFSIQNAANVVAPIEQAYPSFPNTGIRRGQEGWVRVNFVISADGRAIDPVIVDSVGGVSFENAVLEVIPQWSFAADGEMYPNNTADIRFEIYRGRDMATSNFLRRHRRIVMHLYHEEYDEARKRIDSAVEIGGWNLYESTMLSLMVGRVEGAEGNLGAKMEYYRRALGVSNRNSLDGKDRRDLLSKLIEMEIDHRQYAAARNTLRLLDKEPDNEKDLEALSPKIEAMEAALVADAPIAAMATLFIPSGSASGTPIWTYVPARQSFSFDALSGNVERFEVRCDRHRLQGPVEVGKTWSLPEGGRNCRVFVFGEDEASFEFVEHNETETDVATGQTAVAMNDVLD